MEKPTNPSKAESEQESLQTLMDRAKRAHELVDAVDLTKVARHDKEETSKLDTVQGALEALSSGRDVGHVEGVDEIQIESDPTAVEKSKIIQVIEQGGWVNDIGRLLYRDGNVLEQRPLDLVPHREGLPAYDVCLAASDAPGDGSFGIFVSSRGLFAASIAEPVNKHHWRIARSTSYDNDTELLASIETFRHSAFD